MIWKLTRKILFLLDPEWAHSIGSVYLRVRGFFRGGKSKPVRWTHRDKPTLAGMRLDSPLGVAAGFDKDGELVLGLRSLGFGFIEVGTVTPLPQKGNPKPRLFRLPEAEALINRMGFNSQGAESVAARLSHLRAMHSIRFPIGINLGKNRQTPLENAADDYLAAMDLLYGVSDYLVINLSSPNTPGLTTLQEGKNLSPLLAKVREKRDSMARSKPGISRPLFLKISPDLEIGDLETAVKTAMDQGFEGIIATNTSKRRDFALLSKANAGDVAEEGGLSGAPLRELALDHIVKVRTWMKKDKILISVGGLGEAGDAVARRAAGADLLQVYTNFIYQGPSYPLRIAKAMSRP
jgi:dihydroorotate dehydrogenase